MRKGTMTAEPRTPGTKGALRKMRTEGRVPGTLYGSGVTPVSVTVGEKDVSTALRTGVRVLDLRLGSESVAALLKDVEYDHLGERLIHVDFQRLVKGDAIEIRVPITFKGTPVGLKEGGVFNVLMDTLEVSCQPEEVPDAIEVDVTPLEMGESLHVREIPLPPGVEAVEEPEIVVAVVTHSDKEAEAAPTVPEEAAVMPEVIGEAERKAAAEAKGAEGGGGKKEKDKEK